MVEVEEVIVAINDQFASSQVRKAVSRHRRNLAFSLSVTSSAVDSSFD